MLAIAVLFCAFAAEARDRAVLIYPRERSFLRRVFYTSHQRDLRTALSAAYEVAVHEQVAGEEQLFAIDVTDAKLLVISGHGDPFAIYMGGRGRRTLDSSDIGRLRHFLSGLAPDATIVLQSCETGRGFAHVVKEAAGRGRRVIAARGEIPRDGLRITSLAPLEVTISCGLGDVERWDCTLRLR